MLGRSIELGPWARAARASLLALCALTSSCAGPSWEGQATDEPQLFAAGPVTTPANEFATTFSPDGRSVYFNRVGDDGAIPILVSRWEQGAWTEARPVAFTDARFLDVDPFVSADGERLYFTTDRSEGAEPSPDFDIWMAEREGAGWAQPTRLPSPPNSPASEAFVSATREGTLYFASTNTPGGTRRLFRSVSTADGFGPAEEVQLGLAPEVALGNPLIFPDEQTLVFRAASEDDPSDIDLFVSRRDAAGRWGTPVALPAPINSPQTDYAPGLGPGGRVFLFSSTRPGVVPAAASDTRPPGDLYFVTWPPGAP